MKVKGLKKNSSQTFAEGGDRLRIAFRLGTNSISGDQESDVGLAGFQGTDENRSIVGRRVGSFVDRLSICKRRETLDLPGETLVSTDLSRPLCIERSRDCPGSASSWD